MIELEIELETDTHDSLEKMAEEADVTIQELCERIITNYVEGTEDIAAVDDVIDDELLEDDAIVPDEFEYD